jgi:hypothetical protein
MLPHEKELVELMKDKPFALIGINSDVPRDPTYGALPAEQKLEATRKYVKVEILDKNGLTWRNAIDCGTSGPLATQWNISGWPTLFVIDATGKIRYNGHSGDAMDKVVEQCMAEAQSKPESKK